MNYRRTLIRIVTFLGGIYFFLEFIIPSDKLGLPTATYDRDISNGFIAVSAMALGLGLINILLVHGSKIIFRRAGSIHSVALLIGLGMMLAVTFLDWRTAERNAGDVSRFFVLRDFADRIVKDADNGVRDVLPVAERNAKLVEAAENLMTEVEAGASTLELAPDAPATDQELFDALKQESKREISEARATLLALKESNNLEPFDLSRTTSAGRALSEVGSTRLELLDIWSRHSLEKRLYTFLYTGLFVSLGAAMFSLLGFYIASAAYRAFRIRSGESALMMGAAFIVMLGQIPFGLWIWSALPEVRLWLLSVPSAAAFRAIKIGAGVAGLVMAYRMWFSIESEDFTRRKKDA